MFLFDCYQGHSSYPLHTQSSIQPNIQVISHTPLRVVVVTMSSNQDSEITGQSLRLTASPGNDSVSGVIYNACPAPALKDATDAADDSLTGTGADDSQVRHDDDDDDKSIAGSVTSSVFDRRRAAQQMVLRSAILKQQALEAEQLEADHQASMIKLQQQQQQQIDHEANLRSLRKKQADAEVQLALIDNDKGDVG